jgi:hypothetical protein
LPLPAGVEDGESKSEVRNDMAGTSLLVLAGGCVLILIGNNLRCRGLHEGIASRWVVSLLHLR